MGACMYQNKLLIQFHDSNCTNPALLDVDTVDTKTEV